MSQNRPIRKQSFFYFWFGVRRGGGGGGRVREEFVGLLSHFPFFSTILQFENFPINAISAFIQKNDDYSYTLLV